MSEDFIDEEIMNKIEDYENDLDALEEEISSSCTRCQILDIERNSEHNNIERLQKKRKNLEIKINKYKSIAGIKVNQD